MSALVTMHARNVFIVEFLRQHSEDDRRTIRDIWDAAVRPRADKGESGIGDEASLPTYHRTIAKLVREGQLEEDGPNADGAMLYRVAGQLSALSTFTQTDLNAALWEMSPPDALATYLDAVDYFESRANEVLRKAAHALLKENPRELILRMLKDQAEALADDAEILRDPKAVDAAHLAETNRRLRRLHQLVNGELGISAKVWSFPSFEGLQQGEPFTLPDWNRVKDALERSVFGDYFIEKVYVGGQGRTPEVVAGSDGSTHAGYVRGVRAPQYVEEEGRLVLTFNNSLAYVDLPKNHPARVASPYHGIPLTRAALEDPQNRGMILSKPWFQDLSDSEYEHTKKAALDVVQFRVDERLMTGTARALGTTQATPDSGQLPRPNVLIRDGTVTPQEREFQHYAARNSYGDIVQEGIKLSYKILREVKDSNRRVFAGAVKFTVLRTFSTILNWFIKKHVEPNWDIARASVVSDPVAMTRLFSALPALPDTDYYRSCVVVRPFPAMVVDLRSVKAESPDEWLEYFKKRRAKQHAEVEESGGSSAPWLTDSDVEDDDYVRLCQHADYASFFFGRPGGDPQITVPRFEFMDSLRDKSVAERRARVSQASELIIAGVHHTKWAMDRDHNFLSGRKLPRMVPYVVYEAHEKCKALGHKLESELRQAIAARLSQLKASRGKTTSKVEIEPVSKNAYLKTMRRLLGPPDEDTGSQ
jgi:hypothetical protein